MTNLSEKKNQIDAELKERGMMICAFPGANLTQHFDLSTLIKMSNPLWTSSCKNETTIRVMFSWSQHNNQTGSLF